MSTTERHAQRSEIVDTLRPLQRMGNPRTLDCEEGWTTSLVAGRWPAGLSGRLESQGPPRVVDEDLLELGLGHPGLGEQCLDAGE